MIQPDKVKAEAKKIEDENFKFRSKMYKGSIPAEDIDRDAQYLEIIPEQFIASYFEKDQYGMDYQTKHKPCVIRIRLFLREL